MIIKLYEKNNNPKDLARIVEVLEEGGIIIYPTDTMYAIGCHALKERAVERICKFKGIDPRKHNLSIICYDLSNISEYAKVDNNTFKLMKRNLPGAFTFILNTGSRLPKIFKNRKEVGIRIPEDPVALELIRRTGPIIATSANLHSQPDATSVEDAQAAFGDKVSTYLDKGISGTGRPSTIVWISDNKIEIIRQGDITKKQIEDALYA